ncbi:hypothetical protein Pst134EA_014990 [Puccinia striiformis f. sp. tritici]|uniref:hypothetical protein n=1 Tax=Puccinia striiformis f. sp. tritici TaxID=168172 RepID=UPI002008C9CF|nr:hypothetical protein Pst134EA_014990 [Puccinia striiformis f. sp. tritici]KAH9462902.1 hypothetical protein Pst134EA_014990 [Puccinia striiformis f. sp. tritici]
MDGCHCSICISRIEQRDVQMSSNPQLAIQILEHLNSPRGAVPRQQLRGSHGSVIASMAARGTELGGSPRGLSLLNKKPARINHEKPEGTMLRRSIFAGYGGQADIILERFETIHNKCQSARRASTLFPYASEDASFDPPDLKRDLLVQIESSLLPQLQHNIITLNELLKPADLREEPTTKLELISEIQSRLEGTLDQIYSATRHILPSNITPTFPAGKNDGHLNDLKPFRLHGLYVLLTQSFLEKIHPVCYAYCLVIHAIGLSQTQPDVEDDLCVAIGYVFQRTDTFLEAIKRAINWLKGSELDNIQIAWTDQRLKIDNLLQEYTKLVNQKSDFNHQTQLEPFDQNLLRLTKLAIPIIKLFRLFIDKLSERGMNRNQLPQFTTMSSDQLNTVKDLPGKVNLILSTILDGLRDSDSSAEQSTYHMLNNAVKDLPSGFRDPLRLIITHFLPIVPDTDGFPTQKYHYDWLITWETLFSIATDNFLLAIPGLRNNTS